MQSPELEFRVHDVTRAPFPVAAPDLLFCRFLLTHLREPRQVLITWTQAAAPGAYLLIHETERLEADHPALARYYERVAELQSHYGQTLNIGVLLESCLAETPWTVVDSRNPLIEKPASAMAALHLANIRTWRNDAYASRAFDPEETNRLEASLQRIADGVEGAGCVRNTIRQIIAKRSDA